LGASAAVAAKLAGLNLPNAAAWWQVAAYRALAYGVMLACNAAMSVLFLRSMRGLPSLQATTASLASNILMSGVFGRVVFGEELPSAWLLGSGCIILGVACVTRASGVGASAQARAARQSAAAYKDKKGL